MKIILPTLVVNAAAHGYLSLPMGYRTGKWTGDQSLTDGEDRSWYINKVTCKGFEDRPFIMVNDTNPDCEDGPQPALEGNNDGHPFQCVRQPKINSPCGQKYGESDVGSDGRHQLEKYGGSKKDYPVYKWKLGENQPVAWSLAGYHGGYTSYSLIPEDQVGPPGEYGRDSKTAKAFDANVLEFVDNEVCYKGKLSEKGDCKHVELKDGKYLADGDGEPNQHGKKTIAAVSKVKVPADKYPPGRYVFQWEWDCHKTAQIWQMCVDVEITGKGPVPTPTPPTPTPTPPTPTPPTPPAPGDCGSYDLKSDKTSSVKGFKTLKGDVTDCCSACSAESECSHWGHDGKKCFLKSGEPKEKAEKGHTLGVKQGVITV